MSNPGLRWVVLVLCLCLVGTGARALAADTRMISMSDGIRLSTDIYLPEGKGPWPTVLVRESYVNVKTSPLRFAERWTRHRWAFLMQHTRGRGASEGRNFAFEGDGWADHRDGADTTAWIAKQPWSDGRIATAGESALGIAQLFLAGAGARPLDAQFIAIAEPSLYAAVHRQGVFRKALVEDWLRIYAYDPDNLRLWRAHPSYDHFWEQRDATKKFGAVDAPAVHLGGWFDVFTQGTIDAFEGYNEQGGPHARGHQRLILGPWTHHLAADKAGSLTFPHGRAVPTEALDPLAWFDFSVKGSNNGIGAEPPVTYYVMGDTTDKGAPGNFWRQTDRWPRADVAPTPLYLHADRSAAFAPPPAGEASLGWTSDPAHPVPTLGGPQLPRTSLAPGPMDQALVENRRDVLVFTTEPLAKPIEVTGRLTVRLWISSDAPDTDVIARLCIVGADGKSYNLAEGARRARYAESLRRERLLEPGKVRELVIDLWSTSIVFNRGNRIRVEVASTSYPGYDINPQNGLTPRIAHNTLHLDPAHPAVVILPVAPYLPFVPSLSSPLIENGRTM